MRRCGKSTVLQLFQNRLLEQVVSPARILSLNFERLDEKYPLTAPEPYAYVVERLARGMNYVFLDEVQHVEDFECVVDGLYVRGDIDLSLFRAARS